jgi:hypothetical protein
MLENLYIKNVAFRGNRHFRTKIAGNGYYVTLPPPLGVWQRTPLPRLRGPVADGRRPSRESKCRKFCQDRTTGQEPDLAAAHFATFH